MLTSKPETILLQIKELKNKNHSYSFLEFNDWLLDDEDSSIINNSGTINNDTYSTINNNYVVNNCGDQISGTISGNPVDNSCPSQYSATSLFTTDSSFNIMNSGSNSSENNSDYRTFHALQATISLKLIQDKSVDYHIVLMIHDSYREDSAL